MFILYDYFYNKNLSGHFEFRSHCYISRKSEVANEQVFMPKHEVEKKGKKKGKEEKSY